jgi:hypothetical protein
MRNYHNIESRAFGPHNDRYYVGYGVNGDMYKIRRMSDRSWYARPTAANNASYGGKTLAEISRKLEGGTI